MKEQKMTAADIIKAQAKTPLAMVNQALLSGNFAPAPEQKVREKEVVIGELVSFEKAIYTARSSAGDRIETIAKANNKMVDEAAEKGEAVDRAKVSENKRMVELYKETFKALDALFWTTIKERLGAPAIECDTIGIRKGYKIVQVPPHLSSIGELLFESLMGEPDGESHNCDTCLDYDGCDSPFKKPR